LLHEGSTDAAALPPLIDKAIAYLINQENLLIPFEWNVNRIFGPSDIAVSNTQSEGAYDILLVHRDGGRISDRVRTTLRSLDAVPVVPVREMEAWLIVDPEAFAKATGHPTSRLPADLPRPREIERVPDPKQIMHNIWISLLGREPQGGRVGHLEEILEIVAGNVRLERLLQLRSFIEFIRDLRSALEKMGWPYHS
jgi:Domain of unknown function (DUF4276)